MRILGIDPGTIAMGYGVIESSNGDVVYIDCGVMNPPARSPIGERLSYLYKELRDVIKKSRPDVMAIEQPFVAKNVKTALAIGRAQAVAILAAAEKGIPACEYSPAKIKQSVTGYGASSKEQVQEMVRLRLTLENAPESSDAADALAVALCHLDASFMNNLMEKDN
jgi:crossover junction endodeoxyribonuclease RuvC